jgi:hypothetical protein
VGCVQFVGSFRRLDIKICGDLGEIIFNVLIRVEVLLFGWMHIHKNHITS